MARRGSRARGGSRGPKNNIWTTIVDNEQVVGTGSTIEFPVVADSDWQRGAAAERATILRVRGWININKYIAAGVVGGDGAVFMYLALMDDDAVAPAANVASTYVEEDIMWTAGATFHANGAGGVDAPAVVQFVIDVKAMRKMRSGQTLSLVVTNLCVESVELDLVCRALLRLGGN